MKKRLMQAVTAAALVSTLIATPVFATPSVDDLKQDKVETEGEVNSLQSELTGLLNTITGLENDLTKKQGEIDKASIELEEASYKQAEQYEAMKLRIKYMYEQGDSKLVDALVTATSFSDLVNKAEYVQNVHTYDREKLNEYVNTMKKIEEMKTNLQQEAASMQSTQTALETQKQALNTTITTKQSELAQLDQSIQEAIAAQQEAERLAQEQAQKAAAEAAARQAAQQEAARQSASQSQVSSGSSNNGSSNAGSSYVPPQGSDGEAVVAFARQFIGYPYVLGGTSLTGGADCSGFVQSVYAKFGISLSRTTYTQINDGVGIPFSQAQAGDLIVYDGHIGIYNGSGGLVHASSPSVGIIESASCTYRTIIGVRRVL